MSAFLTAVTFNTLMEVPHIYNYWYYYEHKRSIGPIPRFKLEYTKPNPSFSALTNRTKKERKITT